MAIRVREFMPDRELPEDGVIIFTGRSGSGKTFLISDIFGYYSKKVTIAVLMCGSKDTAREFADNHFPASFIYDEWNPERLKQMYEKHEKMVEEGKKSKLLIILDDLAYLQMGLKNNETISRILFNGRHAKILCFISLQYCKGLPPALRQQVKLIFACAEKNPENRKKIYESFNPVFKTFDDFDKVMLACTKNYESVVLDNRQKESYEIRDNVFFYKAKRAMIKLDPRSKCWSYHRRFFKSSKTPPITDNPSSTKRTPSREVEKIYLKPRTQQQQQSTSSGSRFLKRA